MLRLVMILPAEGRPQEGFLVLSWCEPGCRNGSVIPSCPLLPDVSRDVTESRVVCSHAEWAGLAVVWPCLSLHQLPISLRQTGAGGEARNNLCSEGEPSIEQC